MERSLPSISDLKELTVQDLILSDEEIEARGIDISNLFQIKSQGEIQGPILKEDLQEFAQNNSIEDFEVKNLIAGEWTQLISHPLFQRRKPEVLGNNSLDDFDESNLFILKNGEKSGPFTIQEIQEKFEKQELLVTDMISNDGVSEWKKLYEIQEFDRRSYQQLPHLPKDEIFSKSAPILEDDYQQAEMEAIVGLAYVSNIKSGMKESTTNATTPKTKIVESEIPAFHPNEGSKRNFTKPLIAVATLVSMIAGYIFVSNMPSKHGPKVTTEKAVRHTIKKDRPTVHKLKPQKRTIASKPKRVRPVKAKIKPRNTQSFQKSEAYKKFKKRQQLQKARVQAAPPEELDAEEFEPEYPVDEVEMDEEMDDISDEEVDDFVKSIHGGFTIESRNQQEEDLEEEEYYDQEEEPLD